MTDPWADEVTARVRYAALLRTAPVRAASVIWASSKVPSSIGTLAFIRLGSGLPLLASPAWGTLCVYKAME